MGCICSRSEDVFELSQPQTRTGTAGRFSSIIARRLSSSASQHSRHHTPLSEPPSNVLTPKEVLQQAADVSHKYFKGEADYIMAAALSLIESAGCKHYQHDPGDVGEPRIGLCQLTLSMAQWLASQQGFTQFGTPELKDLMDPERALYFCIAYLRFLQLWNGQERTEQFALKAYKQGPKNVILDDSDSDVQWRRYLRAKQLLRRLDDAMTAAQLAADADWGPLMHVVQPGETLNKIAQVCGTTPDDILAANPDLDASTLQPNDCIAIPVPGVLPRVYAVQPGDTLVSIAKAHDCSIMRIMARNPELQELREVHMGMVLSLPGLRGGNSSGSKLDSMLERDTRIMSAFHFHHSPIALPSSLNKSHSLVLEPAFSLDLSALRHRSASSPLEAAQTSTSPMSSSPTPTPFVLPFI